MKNFYEEFGKESKDNLDDAFIWACLQGQLAKIKYLLTSPELKTHADIHTESDHGLMLALRNNHFDIVKYLLASKELTEHANIYNNDLKPFRYACTYSNNEILEYLILDYKVVHSQEVKDYLYKFSHPVVEKLLQTRELMEQLNQNAYGSKNKISKL